jgi:hypothetical protein
VQSFGSVVAATIAMSRYGGPKVLHMISATGSPASAEDLAKSELPAA